MNIYGLALILIYIKDMQLFSVTYSFRIMEYSGRQHQISPGESFYRELHASTSILR